MELFELLGLLAGLIIGVSLGLIGGGGSILTVPVFAYLFHLDSVTSTAYSLFIVGAASLVGSIGYMRKGLVSYKTALIFGFPALLAVFLTRLFIVPAIPDVISLLGFSLGKDTFIMSLFALLMLAASYSMIRPKKTIQDLEEYRPQIFNYPMIFAEGLVVGGLTGLVGAGGGFLIIPALVVLSKLPMKMAVGTSLLIISFKSLFGFVGDLNNPELIIDWKLLIIFLSITIVGIFVGSWASNFISTKKLKTGFGYFVIVMGVFVLIKEFS